MNWTTRASRRFEFILSGVSRELSWGFSSASIL
jgi:hypothetical protein